MSQLRPRIRPPYTIYFPCPQGTKDTRQYVSTKNLQAICLSIQILVKHWYFTLDLQYCRTTNMYIFLIVVSCYKTLSYILFFLIINKRPQLQYKLGKFTSWFVCYYKENAYMVAPNAKASRLRKAKLSLSGSVWVGVPADNDEPGGWRICLGSKCHCASVCVISLTSHASFYTVSCPTSFLCSYLSLSPCLTSHTWLTPLSTFSSHHFFENTNLHFTKVSALLTISHPFFSLYLFLTTLCICPPHFFNFSYS